MKYHPTTAAKNTLQSNNALTTNALASNALAFTLVELLLVIGIVGTLAAVISPVFCSVRERSRQSVCVNNMRQVSLAVVQYVADNDNVYPAGAAADPAWTSQVYPYTKSVEILNCPSDATRVTGNSLGAFVDSYAINTNLLALIVFHVPAVPESALPSPSNTVMLFEVTNAVDGHDSFGQLGGASGNGANVCSDSISAFVPCGIAATRVSMDGRMETQPLYATGNIGGRTLNGADNEEPRHSGGANYAACDGHVKWFKPKEVSSGGIAADSYCNQGNTSDPPSVCVKNRAWKFAAAGSGFPGYRLTFSTR